VRVGWCICVYIYENGSVRLSPSPLFVGFSTTTPLLQSVTEQVSSEADPSPFFSASFFRGGGGRMWPWSERGFSFESLTDPCPLPLFYALVSKMQCIFGVSVFLHQAYKIFMHCLLFSLALHPAFTLIRCRIYLHLSS